MNKAKNPESLMRLVLRIARAIEDDYRDAAGVVDKHAHVQGTIDRFREIHPDAFGALEHASVWNNVWETVRKDDMQSRSGMGEEIEDSESLQPQLPEWAEVAGTKLNVPVEGGQYEKKYMVDCALEELRAVERDYERRARTLLQYQRYVRAYISEMHRRGFEPSDVVRMLYKAS